jgi:hypothetical protein
MTCMVRRVVRLAIAASFLASAAPALAQGGAPRSPSDRQVDLRPGAPDLSFDSRMAGASPTPVSETRASGWSDTATGGVLLGFGGALLVGSAVATGFALDASSSAGAAQDGGDDALPFTIVALSTGVAGAALATVGVVFIVGDDEEPAATAHVGPAGGSIRVRF